MKGKFKIVVPSFNCPRYLTKALTSLENQSYKNYQVCVIDDASTLPDHKKVVLEFCNRNDWLSIFHEKNLGPLTGIIDGIHALKCRDEDVIVMMDGDDWLYNDQALEILHRAYSNHDIYLTWGSFITDPPHCIHMNYADTITKEIIDKKQFREITDIFGHLRTFKYRLFREIKDSDFRDPKTKEYFRFSGDKALMYPMLEMAGEKIYFIPDILYVYNINNPLNDFKINRPEQIEATNYIRGKPVYPTLEL